MGPPDSRPWRRAHPPASAAPHLLGHHEPSSARSPALRQPLSRPPALRTTLTVSPSVLPLPCHAMRGHACESPSLQRSLHCAPIVSPTPESLHLSLLSVLIFFHNSPPSLSKSKIRLSKNFAWNMTTHRHNP